MEYHKGKPKAGVNYDAGALMDRLRPSVEEILVEVQDKLGDIPGCPSQYYRAMSAVTKIGECIKVPLFGDLNFRLAWLRKKRVLETFIAVHQTVTFMETNHLPA